jgi:GAF domain-containing protein
MREGHQPVETFSLKDLGVTEGPPDPSFDAVVALAAQAVGTCYALLAVVDHDSGVIRLRSQHGFEAAPRVTGLLPYGLSFTAAVVDKGCCLAVPDTQRHPKTAHHPFLSDLGIRTLLAAPVHCPANEVVASLVVLDRLPRIWTEKDRRVLDDVAFLASQSILLKAALRTIGTVARGHPIPVPRA